MSVRAFSNTQAWVVNKISNSVSVVDMKNNALIATLQTGAEPADVVFTGTAGSATNPARAVCIRGAGEELEVFDPLLLSGAIARTHPHPRPAAAGARGGPERLRRHQCLCRHLRVGQRHQAMTGGKDDAPFEVDLARSPSGPYGGVSPFPDNVNAPSTSTPACIRRSPP